MPANYSPGTPVDRYGSPKVNYPPAKVSLQSTDKENASVSSILLLTHDTTEVQVLAINQAIAGKWISQANIDSSVAGTSVITASGTANYDFMIASGAEKRFVVPIATLNQAQQSVQGVNRLEGLYPGVAFKTFAGAGSVLTVEI